MHQKRSVSNWRQLKFFNFGIFFSFWLWVEEYFCFMYLNLPYIYLSPPSLSTLSFIVFKKFLGFCNFEEQFCRLTNYEFILLRKIECMTSKLGPSQVCWHGVSKWKLSSRKTLSKLIEALKKSQSALLIKKGMENFCLSKLCYHYQKKYANFSLSAFFQCYLVQRTQLISFSSNLMLIFLMNVSWFIHKK